MIPFPVALSFMSLFLSSCFIMDRSFEREVSTAQSHACVLQLDILYAYLRIEYARCANYSIRMTQQSSSSHSLPDNLILLH
jgi:hypothetical protein